MTRINMTADHKAPLSPAVLEVLALGRVARRAEDLDAEALQAIAAATVPAEFS
jgi:hypothetical protein